MSIQVIGEWLIEEGMDTLCLTTNSLVTCDTDETVTKISLKDPHTVRRYRRCGCFAVHATSSKKKRRADLTHTLCFEPSLDTGRAEPLKQPLQIIFKSPLHTWTLQHPDTYGVVDFKVYRNRVYVLIHSDEDYIPDALMVYTIAGRLLKSQPLTSTNAESLYVTAQRVWVFCGEEEGVIVLGWKTLRRVRVLFSQKDVVWFAMCQRYIITVTRDLVLHIRSTRSLKTQQRLALQPAESLFGGMSALRLMSVAVNNDGFIAVSCNEKKDAIVTLLRLTK